MSKVFISYRRSDSQWQTKQLYDALSAEIAEPKKNIFYDLDSMAVGFDFAETIDRAVSECDVLIAVIGPRWLSETDPETGVRRLDDPRDFVRIEIASALRRNIQVVPVLVDGTKMPKPEDLPDDIQKLSFRHGVTLSVASFQHDMDELVRGLNVQAAPANIPVAPTRSGDQFDSNNYVFISHPNDVDEALVREIARRLMADGISLWIYEPVRFGFEPPELSLMRWQRSGGDAEQGALNAIRRARCVLLLIGEGTTKGGFQTKEFEHALKYRRPIVPVVVQEPRSSAIEAENTVVGRPAGYLSMVPKELKGRFVPKITSSSLNGGQFEKSIAMLAADVRTASATYKAPKAKPKRSETKERLRWQKTIFAALFLVLFVAVAALFRNEVLSLLPSQSNAQNTNIEVLHEGMDGYRRSERIAAVETTLEHYSIEELKQLAPESSLTSLLLGWGYSIPVDGFEQDYSLSAGYLERACKQEDMRGCVSLGVLYSKGNGVNEDDAHAVELYRQSCDGGNFRGCTNLGFMYSNGHGVDEDNVLASEFYRKGCDGGNSFGCTSLGVMYEYGEGVDEDFLRAVELYRRGCDGGNSDGCTNLGWMYSQGRGVDEDDARAAGLYRQGCDGGNSLGCTNLGFMYSNGHGVDEDDARAVELFQQGCDGGNSLGCSNLGVMYDNGHGVDEDDARAAKLYRQGCDGGDSLGCTYLADIENPQ